MAPSPNITIEFSLYEQHGLIEASVTPNDDPAKVGYSLLNGGLSADYAKGFPVCRATVDYAADGYAAVFGWTQFVSSSETADARFEMDPIAIYSELSTPFAWYGLKPTLFDAPSRETRMDMIWRAHSFLCVSPDAVLSRRVQAVAGFSWGFDISRGVLSLVGAEALEETEWDGHLELLVSRYPDWTFDPGYRH